MTAPAATRSPLQVQRLPLRDAIVASARPTLPSHPSLVEMRDYLAAAERAYADYRAAAADSRAIVAEMDRIVEQEGPCVVAGRFTGFEANGKARHDEARRRVQLRARITLNRALVEAARRSGACSCEWCGEVVGGDEPCIDLCGRLIHDSPRMCNAEFDRFCSLRVGA